MDEGISAAWTRYMQERGPAAFLELRSKIVASPGYQPYNRTLASAVVAYESGDFGKVRDLLRADMPNLMLSPKAHMLLAMASGHLGMEDAAEAEKFLYVLALEGIEGSGDGTFERPFLVLRTDDEYDLLRQRQLTMTSQALLQDGERVMDRLETADGAKHHFDITDPFRTMGL